MDALTVIDNLLSAIESGDADEVAEVVQLTKLMRPGLSAPQAATPVGDWFVVNEDDAEYVGPFVSEADAQHWGRTWLDPHGLQWLYFQPKGTTVAEAWVANEYGTTPTGAAATGNCFHCNAALDANGNCPDPNCQARTPNLPSGYVPPGYVATTPGARIKAVPPGQLYKT